MAKHKDCVLSGLAVIVHPDTYITIGDNIRVAAHNAGRGKVRIIVDAPRSIRVERSDIGTGWSGRKPKPETRLPAPRKRIYVPEKK